MLVLSNHQKIKTPPVTYFDDELNDPLARAPKILLVEDSLIIQIAMLGILQEHSGYIVDVANTGEEAVTLFPKGFDLAIMDVGLPGIDGIEATKKIRELYPLNSTPIVAHTAHGDEVIRKKCFDVGMTAFISKGDSLEFFNQVIADVIGGGVAV
jgi:CheY-like chemotaxis protein